MKQTVGLLILLVLFACSSGDIVKLNSFSPEGETDIITNFTLEFNKNLAPADTLGKWSDEQFVVFEPAIKGRFKWLNSKTLIFSPSGKLKPIQEYKAHVSDKVLFNSGFASDFEEKEFSTPAFEVLSNEYFWDFNKATNSVVVKANIRFNYEVNPALLKDYLDIRVNNQEIFDYTIVSKNEANVMAIEIRGIGLSEKRQKLFLSVKSGLMSVIGKKGLKDDRDSEYILPPLKVLSIKGLTSGVAGKSSWIDVKTTQKVDEESITKYLILEPKCEYTTSIYDNKFRVKLNKTLIEPVKVKILKGLKGIYGGELEHDFIQEISFGDLKPALSFENKTGKYLWKDGFKNLRLSSINNDKLEISVSKVFKNNIVHFLNEYSWDYYYPNDNKNYYIRNFGKKLYSETINLSENKNQIESVLLNLDSAATFKRFKGVYIISANSDKKWYLRDSKIVVLSDLGIIAKSGENQIIVFVNSIHTTNPIIGANVKIHSESNQVLLEGVTNEFGVAEFSNIEEPTKGFRSVVVTVEHKEDFNYLDMRESEVELSRYDIGGQAAYSNTFNTFLYSARNLYRPGEDVHLSGIIRDDKLNTVSDLPVFVQVFNSRGKRVLNKKQLLNEQGSFELSFNIPDYYPTGNYRADVFTGSDKIIGSYKFGVEEFVPDKLRATITTENESYKDAQDILFEVNSEYLFGAPAAELSYKAELQLIPEKFRSKKFKKFEFESKNQVKNRNNIFKEGKLDAQGNAKLDFFIPDYNRSLFKVNAVLALTIFDVTGRPLNRVKRINIFPRDTYVGVKGDSYYYGDNENIEFEIIAVNNENKPVSGSEIKAVLVKNKWSKVLRKDRNGNYYYASEKTFDVIDEQQLISLDKPTKLNYNPGNSGSYELRLYPENSNQFVAKSFYVYGWNTGAVSNFDVDKEGRITIVADKEKYSPNEDTKLLFKTPFDGKLLVTVERNGVYDYIYKDVVNNSAEVVLNIREEYLPNVYVSATLFKPHKEDNFPLIVAHGVQNIFVEKAETKYTLNIEAPEKIKPNNSVQIKIKTNAPENSFITLAAVDEGILSIKGYNTPDAHAYMYGRKRLSVNSYDLYHLLLPEIFSYKSSVGGDALAGQLKKRTNPIKSKRFKLVSYWSGITKVNSNGEAVFKVDVPQYNGELRLMALAYNGKNFGAAEKPLKVSEDVIVESELPRVITGGDTLISTVTLLNTTNEDKNMTLVTNSEGNLKVISGSVSDITVPAKGSAKIINELAVGEVPGIVKINYKLSGDATSSRGEEISIRPAAPLITESLTGVIDAGKSKEFKVPGQFLAGTTNSRIMVSNLPVAGFADKLKDLVGYPYGCLEQTTSKAFPQLYLDEIIRQVSPGSANANPSVYYVNEAIRKLKNLQLSNGGLGFWSGSSVASEWSSVYAAHFITEAEKAGYVVSTSFVNRLTGFVSNIAKRRKLSSYSYRQNGSVEIKNIADKSVIYALYVLALRGEADIAGMNYYKIRTGLLTTDMQYMLAGAFALAGDLRSYNELIPENFTHENSVREYGRYFDSPMRSVAVMLNILAETSPESSQIPQILKYLEIQKRNIVSTQDQAWLFIALGKLAQKNRGKGVIAEIYDEDILVGEFDNSINSSFSSSISGNTIKLVTKGEGKVYYFINSEGIPASNKVEDRDNLLKIRRVYSDYETGAKLTNKFKQGQLLKVRLTISNSIGNIENIVISDMLPSAFEIENARLNNNDRKVKSTLSVDHEDIRDDRLLLFTNLDSKSDRTHEYLVRVVNKGKFILPPVAAEAMYSPEIISISGSGQITVK